MDEQQAASQPTVTKTARTGLKQNSLNLPRLAFIEEREAHIRVAEYFLGRVGAGVADEA